MIQTPSDLEWIEGDLPDVHSVPYNCLLLVWFVYDITQEEWERSIKMHPKLASLSPDHNGLLSRITMCLPYKNQLNPLRWCDLSCSPIGYQEKVKYYAWIKKGSISKEE